MRVGGIGIVPAGLEFLESDNVGAVAVDLVRRHVNKGCIGAGSAGGLEHVEGAGGIGVKVVEGDRRRAVMAGLGGSVDDGIGLHVSYEVENPLAITDIEFVMDEAQQVFLKALLVPPCISLGPEEDGALVVIDSVNLVTELVGEVVTDL